MTSVAKLFVSPVAQKVKIFRVRIGTLHPGNLNVLSHPNESGQETYIQSLRTELHKQVEKNDWPPEWLKTKARLLSPSLGGKTSSVNVLLKAKFEYGFEEVLDGVRDFLSIRWEDFRQFL